MQIESIIILTNFFLMSTRGQGLEDDNSEVGLNAEQLIIKNGYPYLSYTVQTDDGYLLKLQRISQGRQNKTVGHRHSVLLMPGIFSDSSVFVNMGRKGSLAFALADAGYDVWLGNYRGSFLSRKHIYLNPDIDGKQFWDFSFHEIGYYDVPAFIDCILNVTNKRDLYYIGHSQGSTSYHVMLSEKPQYAKKIRFAALLAPAGLTEHTKSIIFHINKQYINYVKNYSETYNVFEVAPFSKNVSKLNSDTCKEGSPLRHLCGNVILAIAGWTPHQLNKVRIPVILSNTPSGSSMKQCLHYLQLDRRLQKYDYGGVENLRRYGQVIPPEYNLSKATPPTGIYYGDSDWLTDPKDVDAITSKLPNVFTKRMYRGFNHLDLIWGIDAPVNTFTDILKDMKLHS